MLENWEKLKDWLIFDCKITTPLAMQCHEQFCAEPTREKAVKLWAVLGADEPVNWGAIMGFSD